MKKQLKDLTIKKSIRKKTANIQNNKEFDLDFIKSEIRSKIHEGFDNLNQTLKSIPIEFNEIIPLLLDLQKSQGWILYFIDSLSEKNPVENKSPQ